MQSTGSTSSQPSLDSLSSGDSFLFSDDDSEVFLSEEGESTTGVGSGPGEGVVCMSRGQYSPENSSPPDSPGSRWAHDGFREPADSGRSQVSESCERSASSSGSSSLSLSSSCFSSSSSGLGWSSMESEGAKAKEKAGGTQGDMLFAQKCLELQGFVRPLLELLNGLKKGRFDKGLSSFQQSVAMDRIQRIVGVLQKPHIGEKYLPTLLQVEMMLKLWFPHVALQSAGTAGSTERSRPESFSSSTPPHKHKDQLHIPVKKRRLSWSDTDSCNTPPPIACKRAQVKSQRAKEEGGEGSSASLAPSPRMYLSDKRDTESSGHKANHWSEPSLTWVHVAPIFSPPKSCLSHEGVGGTKQSGSGYVLLTAPPPTSRGSPATQDSSISSTTSFSEAVGCQNQPGDMERVNPERGPEGPLPLTPLLPPSSRPLTT